VQFTYSHNVRALLFQELQAKVRHFRSVFDCCALLSLLAQPSLATSLDASTMKAALKTATPEEDGFIDKILDKVNKGVVPVSMVESTFQWARQKPKHKFQYFKRGLIQRAASIGVEL
jgi:hypothetical protein